jgi:hypothetical protein
MYRKGVKNASGFFYSIENVTLSHFNLTSSLAATHKEPLDLGL